MLTYFFADTIASEWQEWSAWSQCTASCGKGAEIRARACNKPDVGGFQSCPGNSTESRECNQDVCTGPGGIQSKDNTFKSSTIIKKSNDKVEGEDTE